MSLELFCRCRSPHQMEEVPMCCPQACRSQTGWNRKVDDTDSQSSPHTPIRKMSRSWSRALLPEHYKPPHYPLQGEHSPRGAILLFPSMPDNSSYFSLSSNSVSVFLFGISVQRQARFQQQGEGKEFCPWSPDPTGTKEIPVLGWTPVLFCHLEHLQWGMECWDFGTLIAQGGHFLPVSSAPDLNDIGATVQWPGE